MTNKHLFILTSAIKTSSGFASTGTDSEERFFQTLQTIDSIKSRVKEVEIWLCDSSIESLDFYMTNIINGYDFVKLFDFSGHKRVIEIRNEVDSFRIPVIDEVKPFYRLGFIKNLTELYVLSNMLEKIEESKYKRVFKISGRYFLYNQFDLNFHNTPQTITLMPEKKSTLCNKNVGSDYYRHCAAWSFCPSLINDVKNIFLNIQNYMSAQIQSGLLGDIEHGLYLHTPKDMILEVQKFGLIGKVNNKKFGWF